MSAGSRKYPSRLATPAQARHSETGQLIAWSLMLGALLTLLAAGYFGIVP